ADDETPGQYRKVGPSLRHVASKVDLQFLYSWVENPTNFRPSTKMPRFFGLNDHLVRDKKVGKDGELHTVESEGHKQSVEFEPVEIRAISEFLLASSEPFTYIEPPKSGKSADAKHGKELFETRGCLACHQHDHFPKGKDTQGPDLSRIKDKLSGDNGKKWLYSWVREPNRY